MRRIVRPLQTFTFFIDISAEIEWSEWSGYSFSPAQGSTAHVYNLQRLGRSFHWWVYNLLHTINMYPLQRSSLGVEAAINWKLVKKKLVNFDSCQFNISYICNIRLQASTLARKCDISHWFPCGADRRTDERTYGHVITKISRMDRLPNFLTMVLRY